MWNEFESNFYLYLSKFVTKYLILSIFSLFRFRTEFCIIGIWYWTSFFCFCFYVGSYFHRNYIIKSFSFVFVRSRIKNLHFPQFYLNIFVIQNFFKKHNELIHWIKLCIHATFWKRTNWNSIIECFPISYRQIHLKQMKMTKAFADLKILLMNHNSFEFTKKIIIKQSSHCYILFSFSMETRSCVAQASLELTM